MVTMPATTPETTLSDLDRRILRFEDQWQGAKSAKSNEIRRNFGISSVQYHHRLAMLVDDPDALRAAPQLIHRLQNVLDARFGRAS